MEEDNKTTKKCSRCHIDKEFSLFNKCKRAAFGLHNHCRECQRIVKKNWHLANKHLIPPIPKEKRKEYQEKINQKYHSDPEYREKMLERNKLRRREEDAKSVQRKYEKMRRDTDINYKLAKILRGRTRTAIAKVKLKLGIEIVKCDNQIALLGCTLNELKNHMENKFLPGMTWQNHGYGDNKWHIDHIIPCDSFDLSKEEEQRKCFHYSNLQPLWQHDNLSKSNKIISN
jgi:hypothetical protein